MCSRMAILDETNITFQTIWVSKSIEKISDDVWNNRGDSLLATDTLFGVNSVYV